MDEMNGRWAHALLDGLAAAGVRHAVVSPGSRSTPLALAALRHPGLTTRVVLDERSAAFVALGLAKAEETPAVVIATSGSAVANWHPAVIEADRGRVPLILLSADRPPELQSCGANQTIDQIGLFGTALRAVHALPPAEADSGWLRSLALRVVGEAADGPVQVNVPFREPLVPGSAGAPPARSPVRAGRPRSRVSVAAPADLVALFSGRPGLIVCGCEDLRPAAEGIGALAWAVGAPLLADPLSGLRTEDNVMTVVSHYDALLRHPAVPAPEWILRLGGEPVSKMLGQFLQRHAAVPQVVVSGHPRWADPHHTAHQVVIADPGALCAALAEAVTLADPGWLAHWQVMDQWATPRWDQLPEEGWLVRGLAQGLAPDAVLFSGNSLAIRQFDWFMGLGRRGLRLLGNRGASGIDGNVSTFAGLCAARPGSVAVLGDLTLLHDLTGLQAARDVRGALVVVNNGGGGIFDYLPQAALDEYATGWLTPQEIDMAAVARLFGLDHQRTASGEEAAALALAAAERPGLDIVELVIDRPASLAAHRAWFNAVAELEGLNVP